MVLGGKKVAGDVRGKHDVPSSIVAGKEVRGLLQRTHQAARTSCFPPASCS